MVQSLSSSQVKQLYKNLSFNLIRNYLEKRKWILDRETLGHDLLRYISPSAPLAWVYFPSNPPKDFETSPQYAEEYNDMITEIISVICRYYQTAAVKIINEIFRFEKKYDYIKIHLQSASSIGSVPILDFGSFIDNLKQLLVANAYAVKMNKALSVIYDSIMTELLKPYSMCHTFYGSFGVQIAVENTETVDAQGLLFESAKEIPFERRSTIRLLNSFMSLENACIKRDVTLITQNENSFSELACDALINILDTTSKDNQLEWNFDLINDIPLTPDLKEAVQRPIIMGKQSKEILQEALSKYRDARTLKDSYVTRIGYITELKKDTPENAERKYRATVKYREGKKDHSVVITLNDETYITAVHANLKDALVKVVGTETQSTEKAHRQIKEPVSFTIDH